MSYRIVWTNPASGWGASPEKACERIWDSRDMAQLAALLAPSNDPQRFRGFRVESVEDVKEKRRAKAV